MTFEEREALLSPGEGAPSTNLIQCSFKLTLMRLGALWFPPEPWRAVTAELWLVRAVRGGGRGLARRHLPPAALWVTVDGR